MSQQATSTLCDDDFVRYKCGGVA